MFLTNKTTVVAKIEATPYTAETLAASDFNVRINNDLTYSTEVAEFRRKILLGDLDFDKSVMGKQTGSVSFSMSMAPGSATSIEPDFAKLLKACGWKQTAYGLVGIGWTKHAANTHVPITLEVIERDEGATPAQLVVKFAGMMGEATISIGQVGEPVQIKFEFKGRLVSITDRTFANLLSPTSMQTTMPPAVLSTTVLLGSVAQDLDKFEINCGNDVQEWVDPAQATGVKGYYIAGHEPLLKIDPTSKLLASDGIYTAWLAATTAPITVFIDAAVDLTISALAAQYTGVGNGERNGARISEKTFLLTRTSGNDSMEILQGAKA